MPMVFFTGRILFVAYFVLSGLQRLMNVAGGAETLGRKIVIPGGVETLLRPVESAVGLSSLQIVALLAGAIQLFAGLLMAFNVGTRFMAAVLIIFTVVDTFYGNDFLNLPTGQREAALMQIVLQISLIGGLLVFFALGSARPGEPQGPKDV